jgi:hypothetical protein
MINESVMNSIIYIKTAHKEDLNVCIVTASKYLIISDPMGSVVLE